VETSRTSTRDGQATDESPFNRLAKAKLITTELE